MTKLSKLQITALILSWLINTQGFAKDNLIASTEITPTSIETTPNNDPAIGFAIKRALPIDTQNTDVAVKNGVVFLSGELNSVTDYESVVTLTRSTPGVTEINADKLSVKGSHNPLKDTFITAMIKGAILRSDILGKDIPTWSVHVETKDGIVYLSGIINSPVEKQNVLKVVDSIKGISEIKDQLVITNDTPI